MNGRFNDLEYLGSGDLMRLHAIEAQITTAKQLHGYQVEREKASALRLEQARRAEVAQIERQQIEEERYMDMREIELARHRENRRLAIAGIVIAVISLLVAVFK